MVIKARAIFLAVLCVVLTVQARSDQRGVAPGKSLREEIAAVLSTLAIVYDTARVIEDMKAEQGALPRITTPAELSRARFGSDAFADMLHDGWKTPLHVETDPASGYVVAAAGSDRRFERESWAGPAATRSGIDDIVLRNGKLVRSPEEWAVGAAEKLAGSSLRDLMEGMREVSPHQRTLSDLRSIASAALTYEVTEGALQAADSAADLARYLVPDFLPAVPRADGWGRPFHVAIDPASRMNLIVSAGPDGELDPTSWTDASKMSDDIVMKDFTIIRNSEAPAAPRDALAEAYVDYLAARGRFEQR